MIYLFLSLFFSPLLLAQQTTVVPLPIYFNNQYITEVQTLFNSSGKVQGLNLAISFAQFDPFIDKILFQKVQNQISNSQQKFIPLKKLKDWGLIFEYDEENLLFELKLKLAQQGVKDLSLRKQPQNQWNSQAQHPENYSGFLNFRNSKRFSSDGVNERLKTQFDGAFNFHSLVLEGRFRYDGNEEEKWIREDFTFIKDSPKTRTRYSFGDLNYSTIGYQSYRQLGGLSASTNFSLNPYEIVTPLNNKEFILKSRSRVRIFVNNQLVEILNLSAGRYNLNDFPINNGINEVYMEIQKDNGEIERLYFNYTLQEELLKEGLSQFSYTVGTQYTDSNGQRKYNENDEDLTLSLFHRHGFSKKLTAGLYADIDKFQSVVGPEMIYATDIGNLKFTFGQSDTNQMQDGQVYELSYDLYDYEGPLDTERRFQLSYEYKTLHFAQLGNLSTENSVDKTYSLGYRQQVYDLFAFNMGVSYSESLTTYDAYSGTFSIFKNWSRYLSSSVSFTRSRDTTGVWNNSVIAFVNINFHDGKHYSNLISNSDNHQYKANFRGNYFTKDGSLFTDFAAEDSDDVERYDVRGEYRHRRFDTYVNANKQILKSDDLNLESHETTVGLSGAFVFAGGKMALSRPIQNSFALFDTDESLKEYKVAINGNNGPATPKVDSLGPAVVENLVPYQYARSQAEIIDTGDLVSLEKEYFPSFSTYKSGHLFILSAKSHMIVKGVLLDWKGRPLKYQMGRLVNKQGQVEFFTNSEGEFFIEEVIPGENRLDFENKKLKDVIISLKKTQKGLIDLGKIYVKKN